jgi:hypothetical protein
MGNLAADLTKLLDNFTLSEAECEAVEIQAEDVEGAVHRGTLCLVGKLLSDRIVSKEIIKSTLLRGWKLTGPSTFKVLGANLFIIEFKHAWDKSNVLEGRPWIFEGNLFAVEEFNGLTPPTQLTFAKAAFWVRMFNLPLACMGTDIGHKIGSSVGEVEDVDIVDDGVGWGEFLRVRIVVDLTKPLARGRMLKVMNKSVWVAFQYEKLPRFCFRCGVIRHGVEGCSQTGLLRTGEAGEPQYGSWMKALSPKRRQGTGRWGEGGGSAPTHPHGATVEDQLGSDTPASSGAAPTSRQERPAPSGTPGSWRWLMSSPAAHYESHKLELPGAWEPSDSSNLCLLVEEKRPTILFLMETKLQRTKMTCLRVKLGFDSMFVVDSVGRSGGLALFWKEDVQLEIQNYSNRHINAVITEPGQNFQWKLTGFYGHPETAHRGEGWSLTQTSSEFLSTAMVVHWGLQ